MGSDVLYVEHLETMPFREAVDRDKRKVGKMLMINCIELIDKLESTVKVWCICLSANIFTVISFIKISITLLILFQDKYFMHKHDKNKNLV